jgi:hypothetical protein
MLNSVFNAQYFSGNAHYFQFSVDKPLGFFLWLSVDQPIGFRARMRQKFSTHELRALQHAIRSHTFPCYNRTNELMTLW